MATSDKDILITPNKYAAAGNDPKIEFRGSTVGSSSTITMVAVGRTDNDGVLAIKAADGDTIAAFSEQQTGSLFSVTDEEGVTKFEVNETGVVNTSGSSGALGVPVGFTTQRPESPQAGYTRWNSNHSCLEVYNGSEWTELISDYFPSGSTIIQ